MVQTTESARPGLRQEALAVLGIFLAVFLFLSLFTFSFRIKENWCGEIGILIAQVLFGFIGWGSYLFPTLILLLSLLSFSPKMSCNRLPHVVAGLTGAVISFCGLLSSLTIHDSKYFSAGGFLGKTVFILLDTVVGHGGTVLVFVLILLFSFMLSVRLSLYQIILSTKKLLNKPARTTMASGGWKDSNPGISATKNATKHLERTIKDTSESPALQVPMMPEVKELQTSVMRSCEDETLATKMVARGDWQLPPLTLLNKGSQIENQIDNETYYNTSQELEQKLRNFGVSGKVVGISPGPVVTTYEYSPAPGVKINKIVGLADDLALGLRAQSVRVVGSVPGKAALGIEIPNEIRQIVYIRELIAAEAYRANSHKLAIALGLDVVGNLAMANLAKMPHLLIAGATGAGKSVGINTIIASILYNATPEEVRFLMVDPKRIELSGYEGIPHLLHPVVVDPKLASRALNWAVREMERRYRLLEEARVKSFDSYNETSGEKLPYIVVIVDELADLMMVASKDVEAAIARLAQMARAAGIHLILATQRPSVDVLTGLIKANFPTRISFKVSSKIDSRTILDASGAEHLLGAGDMLFLAPGTAQVKRIHGAYISEKETSGS